MTYLYRFIFFCAWSVCPSLKINNNHTYMYTNRPQHQLGIRNIYIHSTEQIGTDMRRRKTATQEHSTQPLILWYNGTTDIADFSKHKINPEQRCAVSENWNKRSVLHNIKRFFKFFNQTCVFNNNKNGQAQQIFRALSPSELVKTSNILAEKSKVAFS